MCVPSSLVQAIYHIKEGKQMRTTEQTDRSDCIVDIKSIIHVYIKSYIGCKRWCLLFLKFQIEREGNSVSNK